MVVKTALSHALRTKLLLAFLGASMVASLLPQEGASIPERPAVEEPQPPDADLGDACV